MREEETILDEWMRKSDNYRLNLAYLKEQRSHINTDDVKQYHEEVFSKMDCLTCANCCKTTPPIVTTKDIKRIAKHLGLSKKAFERDYVIEDVDGERSFSFVPCKFLEEDNTCAIYEVRPLACRRYPHTDDSEYPRRPKLNAANADICPAAWKILDKIKQTLNNIR